MKKSAFEGKSLPEIRDVLMNVDEESDIGQSVRAEFLLRQTEFQERAARATEETAKETAHYTKYMRWSLYILAISAGIGTLLDLIRLAMGR